MEKIELAAKYHDLGFGCSQSVLASFAQDFGLSEQLSPETCNWFWIGDGQDV